MRAPVGSPTVRYSALASALAFAGLAAWYAHLYFYNVVDDALISVRFAENLAQGHGLVFNAGERVEGYTNFLWLLVSALLYWPCRLLGVDLAHALSFATIASAAAVVALVVRLGHVLWPGRLWPVVAAVGLTALDGDFGVWAILGLEKHFLTAWALLALLLSSTPAASETRRALSIGSCLCCVMLTRPDGGLFVAAFFGSQLLALRQPVGARGALASLRGLLVALAVVVVGYGAYFAGRYAYFGELLPNTFHLKVSGARFDGWGRGVEYLRDFLVTHAYVPLAAFGAVAGLGSPIVRTLLAWVLAHALYVTYVGGDFYPGHRFYIVLVAPLALLAGELVYAIDRHARWVAALVALALVGCVAQRGFTVGPLRTEIERFGRAVDNNRKLMLWLREVKPKGASILTGDIGAAGHYADMYVHDYYGVIDKTIARSEVPSLGRHKAGHEKVGSASYFLPKRPTFIKVGYLPGEFHGSGYFLRGDIPRELDVAAIWMRDPLAERGHWDEQSALRFSRRDPELMVTGDAFDELPRRGSPPNQQPVFGASGGYLSSYHRKLGDRATGSVRTAPFPLHGDQLVLRVGGGHDPGRLRVELRVGGERIASFTGYGFETLTRRTAPIARYRGQLATLEVHDESTAGWGHIMVDEVVQWTSGAPARDPAR